MPESNLQPQVAHDGVLTASRLKCITGYKSEGHLRKYLDDQGIIYFPSPEGPWTTIEFIKMAGLAKMGISVHNEDTSEGTQKWL